MTYGGNPPGDEGLPIDPELLHGYKIEHLDRGAHDFTFTAYSQVDGKGPTGTVTDLCASQDSVRVLDAGCGTGRQLYEVVHYPAQMHGLNVDHIKGRGISNFDFRGLSRRPEVNQAFQSGRLDFLEADLERGSTAGHLLYDLVYAHEVLIHSKGPNLIVSNLWHALKDGGVMYFDAFANQTPALARVLWDIQESGGEVLFMPMEGSVGQVLTAEPGMHDPEQRFMYKVTKPKQYDWLKSVFKSV